MKDHTKFKAGLTVALLAMASCQMVRADLSVQNALAFGSAGDSTAWATDPNGNSPFYSSVNLATESFSGVGNQTAASGAAASVLAETFTITNTAGIGTAVANTNYVLTGISLLISGMDGTHAYSVHLFDVTTNLVSNNGSIYTGSGAAYFGTNDWGVADIPTGVGDLLGGGSTNDIALTQKLSGGEQQDYLGIQNGPNYLDQVVLAAGHTYALEVWIPAGAGTLDVFKCSAAPLDAGGELMASPNSSLANHRITGSSSGFYGSAQHTWAIALYGYPATNAPSVSTSTNITQVFVVDDFNPVTNPNAGTNIYNVFDDITNIYADWYGTAVTNGGNSIVWDPTMDAQTNANSGSLKITAVFASDNQFVISDAGSPIGSFPGIQPSVQEGLNLLTFQCDVRFQAGDPITYNGPNPTYGHLLFGLASGNTTADVFPGAVEVPAGNTNWVHVSIPLNPSVDPNLLSISNIIMSINGGWYQSTALSGTTVMWVDNLAFTYTYSTSPPALPAAPTVTMQKAVPDLRIFASSLENTYDRAIVTTADQGQSWIGGTYPVTYSFSILSYPNNNINQTMLELIPANSLMDGTTSEGAEFANEYADYQAGDLFWLYIAPNGAGAVTYSVQWKTNYWNQNPNHVINTWTNSTAIGTWTLTFSDPSNGTVTAPGGIPEPFEITDTNVLADFANPVIMSCGIQPNSTAGEGLYEDWGFISVQGVSGANENEDFTHQSLNFEDNGNLSQDGAFRNDSSQNPVGVVIIPTNSAYWVNWTVPANGYALATGTNLFKLGKFLDPGYYGGYNDDSYAPIATLATTPPGSGEYSSSQWGSKWWELVPQDDLPTADGNQQPSPPAIVDPLSNVGFFLVTTNTDLDPGL